MTFQELYTRMQKDKKPPRRILCLDPGHTTGVAVFDDGEFTEVRQVETIQKDSKTTVINWENLSKLIMEIQPSLVVCENYRVYQEKLDQHTFSEVSTLRLIGGIDLLCYQLCIPIRYQMAIEHKTFCSDAKLKMWQYWIPGMRHSRDAIRVGTYFLLFNKEDL